MRLFLWLLVLSRVVSQHRWFGFFFCFINFPIYSFPLPVDYILVAVKDNVKLGIVPNEVAAVRYISRDDLDVGGVIEKACGNYQ